jgi:hypothetical protein
VGYWEPLKDPSILSTNEAADFFEIELSKNLFIQGQPPAGQGLLNVSDSLSDSVRHVTFGRVPLDQ